MAKAFAASYRGKPREAVARAFTTATIDTYWSKLQETLSYDFDLPEIFSAQPTAELPDTALTLARTIGEAASTLEPLAASYLISVAYTAMLPDDTRSRLGAYCTPPPLAERLVSMATSAGVNWQTCRVLDPACVGGGARRAHRAGAGLTRPHYDLVIENPPYGRVFLAADVRERYRRSLYGHANLYGVFTDLAVRFAKTGGVIAYVTPTSFLAGEYFKALRSLLTTSARPVNIDFVSVCKGVFDDALQETMLATYRKTGFYLHAPTVHFIAPTQDDRITVEKGGGDFANSLCTKSGT